MTDHEIALQYAPIVHFDKNETIPLRAVGYTVTRQTITSPSFPKRNILVGGRTEFAIEYAYYWDYDIQHMYDLEHIWVHVDADGKPISAEGSFHGGFIPMYIPGISPLTDGTHVHACCQPGKHAFVAVGEMFKTMPFWKESCKEMAGGDVLVGGPFGGAYAPTEEDNRLSRWYLKTHLAFDATLEFTGVAPEQVDYMPWEELKVLIPQWIRTECERLRALEAMEKQDKP